MANRLELYSRGAKISDQLAGKKIESFLKNGEFLLLKFTDGHEAWIGWQDAAGNALKGEPYLERLDATIRLPGLGSDGTVGKLG